MSTVPSGFELSDILHHRLFLLGKRGVPLSITHKLGSDHNAQFNIG
jgi:hypothetical protein